MLKEIAKAIKAYNEHLTCSIPKGKTQIYIKSDAWKGEVAALLSPYYQQRIEAGTFTDTDLEALKVEADRIHQIGH